jgi:cathepsin B
MQTSWKADHNTRFDGMSLNDIKSLMGAWESSSDQKLPYKDITPDPNAPDEFFSATQWPNCQSIKEIRDQSTCGSCWAFGAAEAMSDRICIVSNQTLQVRISAEDLLTCCRSCGAGCNGGYPDAAWLYFKNTGIVTGWLYNTTGWCQPYTFPPCDHHVNGTYGPCGASKPTPSCKTSCVSGYNKTYANDRWHASQVYAVGPNVDKIQTEIMTNGPVEAAFNVYEDFLTYRSGVYHHTSGSLLGGHAVKVVGWGVEGGVAYWLVANSWNEGWGDKGFLKIRRGTNECGIESGMHAGIPVLQGRMKHIKAE